MANDTVDQWQEENTLSLTPTQYQIKERLLTHWQHHFCHHQHIIKNNSEGLGTRRKKDDDKYKVAFSKRDLVKSIAEATNPDDIHSLPAPETLARYINLAVASRIICNNFKIS